MLIPPRELLDAPLYERPIENFPDAASVPGARALASDGRIYEAVRWPTGSSDYSWVSVVDIAEDVSADVARFTSSTIEVEVGGALPGPLNFPTLSAAVEYMSKRIPSVAPSDIDPGFIPFTQGTILIRSGWVAEEQLVIDGGLSMGWVRIISEDAQVTVDEASLVRNEEFYDTTSNFPFILVRNGACCPRIKTLFVCDPDGEDRPTTGLHLRSGRYLDDLNRDGPLPQAHGLQGFAINCRVHSGSDAFFTFKSFSGARKRCLTAEHASRIAYVGCRAYGAGDVAVGVASGSRLHSFGLTHPTAGAISPGARVDVAGLTDSAGDWSVTTGGQISLINTTLGGISQSANVWSLHGLIHDARVTTTTYSGLIAPKSYTVATLPAASTHTGVQVYCTDGAAGLPIMAFSDGTNWLRCDTRAPVSDS